MAAVDVAAALRRRIAEGEFRPGDQLPGVSNLTATYKVGRATIDRALRELASEGLIDIKHGSGTFVRERKVVLRDLAENLKLEYRRALAGDMSEGVFEAMTGAEDVHVTAAYATVPAGRQVAEILTVPLGTDLLERTFRHAVDGKPFQVSRSYMTADLAARTGLTGAEVERPGTSTVLQLHATGTTVQDAHFTIEARMPTPEESSDLALAAGTPVVEVWRTLNVEGRAVEVSRGVIRSDMVGYYLDVDLKGIKP